VDRELRHVEAGVEAAGLAPDLLAEAVDVDELLGADRDPVDGGQEVERNEFLDRVRQRVDADAESADLGCLLEDHRPDAALVQHQRQGQTADAGACDEYSHCGVRS
jgi:hypothetical protein